MVTASIPLLSNPMADIKVTSTNKFPQLESVLLRNVRISLKQGTTLIQRTARFTHRYAAKSHDLEKSVKAEVDNQSLVATIFLDTGVAKYGPFVHEGQRSWKPDRFLFASAKKHKADVVNLITKAIRDSISQVGLN